MKILAFESSCDETAAAVVRDGRTVLSNCVASQIEMHTIYGGVVPEIASRKHVEAVSGLAREALERDLEAVRALGLEPVGERKEAADGSFIIVYLGDGKTDFRLELTWLRDHPQKYDLGECEFHLALRAEDYEAAHAKHAAMGCICFENPAMGIYFVTDPDGYWIEIIPTR